MLDLLASAYPWTKAAHVIAMVTWMAGLFYLPRLFVYHVEKGAGDATLQRTFVEMEHKLFRFIMGPAMSATWLFGVLLLLTPGVVAWSSDLWIYVKLAAVGGLTWFHHWLGYRRKDLAADRNRLSGRTYRLMNEVPTLALVIIVVMVIVKPF
jgi:protoporphyrinogen IX oxidase